MAITFLKLKYKNFLSTGNQFTEIDFVRNRTTLIVGENGSGKSTILDALTYALFGKPYRPINIPQLLNTITRKDLEVEIEFVVNQSNYKIIRGLKPHIFEIYKDGEMINKSANNKDYQSTLEKQILKVNFKSFCQVVVLGSATFKPFMQLSAYERREVIEDLLDLQIFTSMNSLLKNRVMMNGHRINDASSIKKTAEEKIKIVKQHLIEMQNNTDEMIAEKETRLVKAKEDLEDITRTYNADMSNKQNYEQFLVDSDKVYTKHRALTKLKDKILDKRDACTKELSFYNNTDNCPTCTQQIELSFKTNKLEQINNSIVEIIEGLDKIDVEIADLEDKISAFDLVKRQLSTKQIELSALQTKIRSLESYITEIEAEILKLRNTVKREDNTKLSDFEAEFSSAEKELTDANSEKELLMAASSLLKDSGIKAKIIKQYVPIINKLINKYLSALDFFVQFELNEEFKETIKSRFRDEFSYASFSEGEKMRINLAILFTWRSVSKLRNSMNTNLLIMDEVFDSSLDGTGVEEFLKLLSNITLETNTFIISHKKDQLLEKFEHVIKFEKKQNFSRIM